MTSDDFVTQNLNRYVRTLGICWVVYGIFRLAGAIWLFSFTNTATVMFGALLSRVPDPFTMMNFFHLAYTLVIILSLVCGVLGIVAGWALLAGQRSGRVLTLAAGFLSLSNIPLGIALGTFSLVVLLPLSASQASAAVVDNRTYTLKGQPSAH